MKTILSIIGLAGALSAGAAEPVKPEHPGQKTTPPPAVVAPEKTAFFNGGEINVDALGVLSRPDLDGAPVWGGGVGLSYFITKGLGVGARGISYDNGGLFLDEVEARIIFRAPLWDRIAPYGYVSGIYAFEAEQAGAGAGGGLEFRFTRMIAAFGETGLRVTTKGANEWQTCAGIRLVF